MLVELKIKNFAIIDELHCTFGAGLNVISGETGAGKSILIGAVSLLLGDRASSDMIRTSEETAVVEALFDICGQSRVKEKLTAMGLGAEESLLLRRVVSRSGKNRVYINGSPATLNMIAALSESLINVCGQHEHQLLLQAENHLDILDEFGGLYPLRQAYENFFEAYQEQTIELRELAVQKMRGGEREDLLQYQSREIIAAALTIGEDEILIEKKKILANVRKLQECAQQAYDILYGQEGAVLPKLKQAMTDIRNITDIDTSFPLHERDMDGLYYQVEDWAFTLRDYTRRLAFDPERLAVIDERLEVLAGLKRKYHGSIAHILDRAEEIKAELAGLANVDDQITAKEKALNEMRFRMYEEAHRLSQRRKETALVLERAVEKELKTLRMGEVRFEVHFHVSAEGVTDPDCNARGMDDGEFYLSANVGEDLKPLYRIASGGELSRIILALKKVLARAGSVSTIVFDEVDSGIGGATAEVVGEQLRDVARHHQVLCITHLPQIACFGDCHYRVVKAVVGNRTTSRVEVLSEADRLTEITRMLGGVDVTDKTRAYAREMLSRSGKDHLRAND